MTDSRVPLAGAVAGTFAADADLAAGLSDTVRQCFSPHSAEGMEKKLANGETPSILRFIRRLLSRGGTRWAS